MMTWNPYSKIFSLPPDRSALYNYVNDAAVILSQQLSAIIEPLIQARNFPEIERKHPHLYQNLLDNGFIIDQSEDDSGWVLDLLHQKLQSRTVFRLTINPTLDCNLRCWYCYQTHTKNCYMSPETQDAVLKFAEARIADEALESFRLSFFGGEPLLKAWKIALPLAEKMSGLCEKYGKRFLLHLTTNGVLLSGPVLGRIKATCPEARLQIPFDGGRHFHNQTKKNGRGVDVYGITLQHIQDAVELGLQVNVRCNYTLENIDSFEELIAEVRARTLGKEGLVSFSLQRVWQEEITHELPRKQKE